MKLKKSILGNLLYYFFFVIYRYKRKLYHIILIIRFESDRSAIRLRTEYNLPTAFRFVT